MGLNRGKGLISGKFLVVFSPQKFYIFDSKGGGRAHGIEDQKVFCVLCNIACQISDCFFDFGLS